MGPSVDWNSLLIELFWLKLCTAPGSTESDFGSQDWISTLELKQCFLISTVLTKLFYVYKCPIQHWTIDCFESSQDYGMLSLNCLVPRQLSLDENVHASLAVHHQSLAFRARLCYTKNEAPEEEADPYVYNRPLPKYSL